MRRDNVGALYEEGQCRSNVLSTNTSTILVPATGGAPAQNPAVLTTGPQKQILKTFVVNDAAIYWAQKSFWTNSNMILGLIS